VKFRDRVCVFPPCRKAADKCDLDHRLPFSQGGNTSADNLQPLCPKHHEMKHDHGWTVDKRSDGATVWTSPTEHTYRK
jgi:predicted restriction endonuclease